MTNRSFKIVVAGASILGCGIHVAAESVDAIPKPDGRKVRAAYVGDCEARDTTFSSVYIFFSDGSLVGLQLDGARKEFIALSSARFDENGRQIKVKWHSGEVEEAMFDPSSRRSVNYTITSHTDRNLIGRQMTYTLIHTEDTSELKFIELLLMIRHYERTADAAEDDLRTQLVDARVRNAQENFAWLFDLLKR